MKRYRVNIKGLTPLVMENPKEIGNPPDKGRDKVAYEREHFKDKLYVHPDGVLYLPARGLFKAAIAACRFLTDKPKGTSFKSWGPMVEAMLIVTNDIELDVTEKDCEPWAAVVNLDPSKGPRGPKGIRVRPMFKKWSGSTEIVAIDDLLSFDVLSRILDMAGRIGGLGSARAMGMGRCEIRIEEMG